MRIIKEATLRQWAVEHARARPSIEVWSKRIKETTVTNWAELKRAFGSIADEVTVRSGKKVIVFNIAGNNYRLISAIHYDKKRVYVLMFLTHAEYSRNQWKLIL